MKAKNPKFLKANGTFHGVNYLDLLIVVISVLIGSGYQLEGLYLLSVPVLALFARYIVSHLFSPGDIIFKLLKRKSYGWSHLLKELNNVD
ncbi:MAG: hypothetical protein KAQ98_13280 [Bacteriovoracaceae bacterium]|nr:hypothetical protein [Bacteriovoracaceae bacterium]